MRYYIGIDAGGTKTDAVLCDETSRVIDHVTGPGCNPMDIGIEKTEQTLTDIIGELVRPFGHDIASLYGGIAGVNRFQYDFSKHIIDTYSIPAVRIEDDRRIVLSGSIGCEDGCGMICGTGSSLSIIRKDHPISQVGGLGYLIDTGGSGFEIGQAGLKHVFRYLDGRGPYTVLADLLFEKLGKLPEDGIEDIYKGGRPFIASMASVVFSGFEEGDEICARILEKGSDDLAELTFAAEKYFSGSFPVVMTGGIFFSYPYYAERVKEKSSVRAKMMMASAIPVYGSVFEAKLQDGIKSSDDNRECFIHSYNQITARKVN